jgi:hypothetical protein
MRIQFSTTHIEPSPIEMEMEANALADYHILLRNTSKSVFHHMRNLPLFAHVSCTTVYFVHPACASGAFVPEATPSLLTGHTWTQTSHDHQYAREHADSARIPALHLGLGMTTCISSNAKLEECP